MKEEQYVESITTQLSIGAPKGMIFRMDNYRIIGTNGAIFEYTPEQFKYSTKEAYEAQNKPKEPELIEGNWYELETKRSSIKYLFKYKNHKNKEVLHYSLSYNVTNKYENSYNPYGLVDVSDCKYIKPANMEDVYKYFPEERPKEDIGYVSGIDLIGEKLKFIKYHSRNGNTFRYNYILDPKGIGANSYIKLDNYQYTFKDVKELSLEEIKWFECCIKANKFIPKEEALKTSEFKVGDWVVLDSMQHAGYKIGDLAQIQVILDNEEFQVNEKGTSKLHVGACAFRFWHKATLEEIAKVTGKKEELLLKEELTSLPEKYQVLCENAEQTSIVMCTLNPEFKQTHPKWGYWKYVTFNTKEANGNSNPNISNDLKIDFTEITFEQFKKWVLKENKPKFEVGKWYKGWTDIQCKYAKFHHLSSCGKYFHWTEGIHSNWKVISEDKKGSNNWYFQNSLVEASIEEIQQYLPDGHVDKIKVMKYPIGKIKIKKDRVRYFSNDISQVKHGNFPKEGLENYNDFEIVGYDNSLYAIRWIDEYGKEVIQGYKEEDLEPFVPEKKYDYEVVHCTTQEEWDFVSQKYNKTWNFNSLDSYGKCNCIHFLSNNNREYGHSSLEYYKTKNTKIYSFSEWCTKFGHKMEPKSLVGRWVKCIKNAHYDVKEGEYLKITQDSDDCWFIEKAQNYKKTDTSSSFYIFDFFELMPEGFMPPGKEMTREELIAEAKRRYPNGTKYICPRGGLTHILNTSEKNTYTWYNSDDQPGVDAGWCKGYLYYAPTKKWAKIVSKPEEKYQINCDPYVQPKTNDNYEVNLVIPKKDDMIDTSVNTIKSIKTELVELEEVYYF